jgi:ribulose-5-phosphate 4-epimerase/fuculose-1-phosphate aldolase
MNTLATPATEQAIRQARIDLAAAHRLAVRDDLHEGTWNHLSTSVPGAPERMLVSPSYMHWSQVRAGDIVEVGPGGAEDALDEAAWIAYRIHYPIHSARPDAVCVMHTHAPYVVALAMTDAELNTAEQNALSFYESVAYTTEYDGVLGDGLGQGEFMADALGDSATVLFLKNHGAVVVGPTVGQTYTAMYLLERACRAQILAMSSGRPLQPVPEESMSSFAMAGYVEPKEKDFRHHHFEAMKRVLDVSSPDYAD